MKNNYEPIVVEQTFGSSIKNVWDALTVPEEMREWYFSNISSFEPTVGFETRFVVHVEDRVFPHIWRLTEVISMKKLAYEWKFEGYTGSGISYFELSDEGQKTTLKLTFEVLEKFPDNIPEFKRESGVIGWNYFIRESLKKYLEEKSPN